MENTTKIILMMTENSTKPYEDLIGLLRKLSIEVKVIKAIYTQNLNPV